jgi:hypothetical protein
VAGGKIGGASERCGGDVRNTPISPKGIAPHTMVPDIQAVPKRKRVQPRQSPGVPGSIQARSASECIPIRPQLRPLENVASLKGKHCIPVKAVASQDRYKPEAQASASLSEGVWKVVWFG